MGSWSTWGADSLPACLWLGQRMPVNWNGMGGGDGELVYLGC